MDLPTQLDPGWKPYSSSATHHWSRMSHNLTEQREVPLVEGQHYSIADGAYFMFKQGSDRLEPGMEQV